MPPTSAVTPARDGVRARAGLMTIIALLLATAAIAGDDPAAPAGSTIRGRVVDEAGKAVPGARVRLYRRASQWDRRNAVIEEATAGPDGAFGLAARPEPSSPARSRDLTRLVLVADKPGLAVGWRNIPDEAKEFAGDVTLTPAADPRTIAVTDADGRPVAGATVSAYGIGDPSSPSPHFRDHLSLRPGEPPLSVVTDAEGHARFDGLPRTKVSFLATRPGFAQTFIFDGQTTIRLTPSATLSGTVTGPDGKPVAGTTVVLHAEYMWEFHRTRTDERGRYRFDDLAARGWDMSAWKKPQGGSGAYKLWLEDDRLAVHETPVTLEPKAKPKVDLPAVTASILVVTLTVAGTDTPVAGARIWGLSTGGRLDGVTDAQGRVTFRTTPGKASVSIASPPPGMYFEGDIHRDPEASKAFEVGAGEVVELKMPPGRRLIAVSGLCTMPDGSPAAGVVVRASSGKVHGVGGRGYGSGLKADGTGRFELDGVASATTLNLHAQTEDGRLAGVASIRTPEKADPAFRPVILLGPTHPAIHAIADKQGHPLANQECEVMPRVGDDDMIWLRQSLKSDDAGIVRVEHVVPGVAYHIQAYQAANAEAKAKGGPFFQIYDDVAVLIPLEPK